MLICCEISPEKAAVAESIIDLQHLSYQVEAAIVGFPNHPPLEEDKQSIVDSGEIFIGAYIEAELVGAISYKLEEDYVDIYRLMVHPDHFRKGIGQSLLSEVTSAFPDRPSYVYTGSNNIPALNLYKSNGFQAMQEKEVAPNLFLTRLYKPASTDH